MPAPEGNTFNMKWPTPEERKEACARFCAHIGKGLSMDSFPDASAKTIRHYAKAFPEEFPPEKLEEAARRGLMWWERLGRAGAAGKIKQFNATAWIFNMKNRAGWRDRVDVEGGFMPKETPGDAGAKVKTRPTGQIALSVMALMAKTDQESEFDADNAGETGGTD